ncbi:transposase [Endozoicomonas sp. ALB032]|uniref:transposase n=1 Tax=Endozoicomonas sp. ALB032 TaxID=3403082 RepID=UPI003BB562B1
MTQARSNLIDSGSTPYYHCVSRCVRRAYLCGEDHLTGNSFEHRRQWVVDRLRTLTSVFAIEVCAYAVMSNHFHLVLHININESDKWNRDEILRRWTTLFTGPLLIQRHLSNAKLSCSELSRIDEYVAEYRSRLKSISWFMRCLNEHLAREANREDGCKGRFWEGRFKSQALLDEAALLTCMAYVDLNPIRAKLASTPEQSDYTSIQKRIEKTTEATDSRQPFMLKPFQNQEQDPNKTLPYILNDYLELVDWSGRAVRKDKKGSIAESSPPILARLEIDGDEWLKTMSRNNRFYRAVGRLKAMKAYAISTGQRWLQGLYCCGQLFQTG